MNDQPSAGNDTCPECGEKRAAHTVLSVCPTTGNGARFPTSAQAMLGRDFVNTVLADVFQGKRDHLREQMLNVVAKVSRRHPWPYFEECVQAEVEKRLASIIPPEETKP